MLALTAECGALRVAGKSRPAGRPHDRAVRRARAGHQPQQEARSAVPDRGRPRHFGRGSVHLVGRARSIACAAIATSSSWTSAARAARIGSTATTATTTSSSASTKSKSGAANIKCRDELSKNSDLRMYTTSIAVRDLEQVRQALGYERINLYGNSYGTRVAQHYARRFPKSTRTVILDGVVNPEVVLGPGDRHRRGTRAGAHPQALRGRRRLRQGLHGSGRRLSRAARAAHGQAR